MPKISIPDTISALPLQVSTMLTTLQPNKLGALAVRQPAIFGDARYVAILCVLCNMYMTETSYNEENQHTFRFRLTLE
jgi:hypothetical protein